MAGLQGAGKTTTVAKLAKFLKDRKKKKVMVVSCDVYRPAAIEQLRLLAEQVGVLFHPSAGDQSPAAIAKSAEILGRIKAKAANFGDRARHLHAISRADRLTCVFNHGDSAILGERHDRIHVRALSEQMNRNDRLGARRDLPPQILDIEQVAVRIDVDCLERVHLDRDGERHALPSFGRQAV